VSISLTIDLDGKRRGTRLLKSYIEVFEKNPDIASNLFMCSKDTKDTKSEEEATGGS
jgi:hypothetical protein